MAINLTVCNSIILNYKTINKYGSLKKYFTEQRVSSGRPL